MPKTKRPAFLLNEIAVAPGERKTIDIALGLAVNHAEWTLPVHVINGKNDGPCLVISAAVHGDEILGIEIIRRVLNQMARKTLAGTLIAVPIVNGPGFLTQSRYLPDRRDLNRSFPGSERGSMAARLADTFLQRVVAHADFGIDLHTAALHRTNLPQIRYDSTASDHVKSLGKAFGAPVIIESPLRDGSLRSAAKDIGVPILLYEGGEALRFDEFAIRIGVRGVLHVMQSLGMISKRSPRPASTEPIISRTSRWIRAPEGGLLRAFQSTGTIVRKGDLLGTVGDPFGGFEANIKTDIDGIIIGRTNLPTVNAGDALFHVAAIQKVKEAESRMDAMVQNVESDPLFDEDEII